MEVSLVSFMYIRSKCKVEQWIVRRMVRQHECTGWTGFLLLAKPFYSHWYEVFLISTKLKSNQSVYLKKLFNNEITIQDTQKNERKRISHRHKQSKISTHFKDSNGKKQLCIQIVHNRLQKQPQHWYKNNFAYKANIYKPKQYVNLFNNWSMTRTLLLHLIQALYESITDEVCKHTFCVTYVRRQTQ